MAEQFCLKWTDFHSSIVSALDSLKCSEDLVDVTLTCEGKNIKAHKVILSACSPYFRGVFKENPCQHPIIILKDVLAGDMTRLLAYMYQGEVTVREEQLPALLQTAQLLQVAGLAAHTLTAQSKSQQQKTSSLSPAAKRVSPQISISKKAGAVGANSPKDLLNTLNVKSNIHQHKRRRNSVSEKSSDSLQSEQVKKIKISKTSPPVNKKSESTASNIDNIKTDDFTEKDVTEPFERVHDNDKKDAEEIKEGSSVKVKNELVEEDEEANPADDDMVESKSPNPFYETSMLARSLLSGAQSVKSDSVVSGGPKGVPVEVKGECLSPVEPEVVLAEEELPAAPANHAAICGDCPHCGTQYSNQSALKYHVRLMHSDLTNRLCCYLCPRSFTVRDTFKEHMWTFHGQRN